MPLRADSNQRRGLRRAVRTAGLSWSDLEASASEIVLFGSRATGEAGADSDWDLLCVGEGRRTKNGNVQLFWISPDQAQSKQWRGSELGSHIARFGKWLKGRGDWASEIHVSRTAVSEKVRRIRRRVRVAREAWSLLTGPYRDCRAIEIRRDVQRLAILSSGGVVPTRHRLDRMWVRHKTRGIAVASALGVLKLPARDGDFFSELIEHAPVLLRD